MKKREGGFRLVECICGKEGVVIINWLTAPAVGMRKVGLSQGSAVNDSDSKQENQQIRKKFTGGADEKSVTWQLFSGTIVMIIKGWEIWDESSRRIFFPPCKAMMREFFEFKLVGPASALHPWYPHPFSTCGLQLVGENYVTHFRPRYRRNGPSAYQLSTGPSDDLDYRFNMYDWPFILVFIWVMLVIILLLWY